MASSIASRARAFASARMAERSRRPRATIMAISNSTSSTRARARIWSRYLRRAGTRNPSKRVSGPASISARSGCNRHSNDRSMVDSTLLVFPQLRPLYQALALWPDAVWRAVVGLSLGAHGLRNTFGMLPSTGVQSHNLTGLAGQLDRDGYRPGKFWAPAISITQLLCGPMLALGLFTRLAACPI